MKRSISSAITFFASIFALITYASETTSDKEWVSLFNGKDLSGWTVKCIPADENKTFWTVEDGSILADSLNQKGHDYVWLLSEHEYDDFTLRLKFQAYRESPGNSGIQIRSRYDINDGKGWLNGPQIDINPPGPWRTGMMWDETRGNQRWIYPEIPKGEWVDESMAKHGLKFFYHDEASGWNDFEISAIGTIITAKLNGVEVTNWDGSGVLDDENHRNLNVGMKGHIALQIHKGDHLKIRYKDIFIREE